MGHLEVASLTRSVPTSLRWALGLLGAAVLGAGAVAVFVTSNGPGTAALIAAGVALVLVAVLAERLESVEAAGMKLGLRSGMAEAAANTKERAAAVAEESGQPEQAAQLRLEAAELRDVAAATARAYEQIRARTGSSWQRTQRLDQLLENAMRTTPQQADAGTVRELFEQGTDGSRIVALRLMQRDPATIDVPAVADAITTPRSAMEQWHGLVAAERAAEHGLPAPNAAELLAVLSTALETGGIGPAGGDRHAAAQRVVELLAHPDSSATAPT